MRATSLFSLLLIGTLVGTSSSIADASHHREEALSILWEAQQEAQALETILSRSTNRHVERRMKRRLNRLETLLVELEDEIKRPKRRQRSSNGGFSGMIVVEDLGDVPSDLPMREVDPSQFEGPFRTSQSDMARILLVLESESFSDGRLSALRSLIPNRSFQVSQVITILDIFDFGDDKVSAAALLHPQIEDPENWILVYGALDFDSDRESLRRRKGL